MNRLEKKNFLWLFVFFGAVGCFNGLIQSVVTNAVKNKWIWETGDYLSNKLMESLFFFGGIILCLLLISWIGVKKSIFVGSFTAAIILLVLAVFLMENKCAMYLSYAAILMNGVYWCILQAMLFKLCAKRNYFILMVGEFLWMALFLAAIYLCDFIGFNNITIEAAVAIAIIIIAVLVALPRIDMDLEPEDRKLPYLASDKKSFLVLSLVTLFLMNLIVGTGGANIGAHDALVKYLSIISIVANLFAFLLAGIIMRKAPKAAVYMIVSGPIIKLALSLIALQGIPYAVVFVLSIIADCFFNVTIFYVLVDLAGAYKKKALVFCLGTACIGLVNVFRICPSFLPSFLEIPEGFALIMGVAVIIIAVVFAIYVNKKINCRASGVQGVVFDMDGVIFDSERATMECWLAIAYKYGIENLEQPYLACTGTTMERTKEIMLEAYGPDFPYDQYASEASGMYHERYDGGRLPVKPGVVELLKNLKYKGKRIGLASSTRRETVVNQLRDAGLLEYFDVIITGDMVEKSKPDPEIFLKACEEMGVEPGLSYAVEDSYNGIRAAFAGGLRPVMVPDLLAPDQEMQDKTEAIFLSLLEFSKYLNE